MADRYWVGNVAIWDDPAGWSSTSGGIGGAGVPTLNDNVFLDANSPGNCIVNVTGIKHCNNLDTTGFTHTLQMWQWNGLMTVQIGAQLYIHGNCTFNNISVPGADVVSTNNYSIIRVYGQFNGSGTTMTKLKFYVFGSLGSISSITATNIVSIGGLRIYAPSSTLSNSPFWRATSDTSAVTHHITNSTQLQAIKDTKDGIYILDNNIDMTGVTWTPIGDNTDAFTGDFDGQGFVISNLTSDESLSSVGLAGLFGFVGSAFSAIGSFERPTIENLTLTNISLIGNFGMGALVGLIDTAVISDCHISNVTITPSTSSTTYCGGLAGQCFGYALQSTQITDCDVDGVNITCNEYGGGLIGDTSINQGQYGQIVITNCFADNVTLTPNGSNPTFFGGLVGNTLGTNLDNCHATGTMTDTVGDLGDFGGFIGYAIHSDLEKCYADFATTLKNDSYEIGGLIGNDNDTNVILNCYAHGSITGIASSYYGIGGFSGVAYDLDTRNSYTSVTIDLSLGTLTSVGGFIGEIDDGTLQNVFSVGVLSGSGVTVGGFIGQIFSGTFTIDNCSWWTGSSTYAIGTHPTGTNALLATLGYGTDESDNTDFQNNVNHIVFAQGQVDAWSFERTSS